MLSGNELSIAVAEAAGWERGELWDNLWGWWRGGGLPVYTEHVDEPPVAYAESLDACIRDLWPVLVATGRFDSFALGAEGGAICGPACTAGTMPSASPKGLPTALTSQPPQPRSAARSWRRWRRSNHGRFMRL